MPEPTTTASTATHEPAAHKDAVLAVKPLGFPWQTQDPFLFCVHHDDRYPKGNAQFGPAESLEGRDIGQDFAGKDGWRMYHGDVVPGFPSHPHRGFETVTVVRRGLLDHSDSLGAAARYGGGDVQWLTAGKGIQHAEMFPLLDPQQPNPVELFQLWLNLPSYNKMVEPHFSMLWADSIPRHVARDEQGRTTELSIVAGTYKSAGQDIGQDTSQDIKPPSPPPKSWASQAQSDVAIWTFKLAPHARFTVPATSAGVNRTLYFFRGNELRVAGQPIALNHLIQLRSDREVVLQNGAEETELLMLQGRPIGEPVVQHGPFVMNTAQEIREAYMDFQRTRFGGWPWQSNDPVHGAEQVRFARHADGRTERPA